MLTCGNVPTDAEPNPSHSACRRPLAFVMRYRVAKLYAAYYVHADTQRYRCGRIFGPNTHTLPITTGGS